MIPEQLLHLIKTLGNLPGLGKRSGKRAVIALLQEPRKLQELQTALSTVASTIKTCQHCHNISLTDPCYICANASRDATLMAVVETVADLWALEESQAFRGHYFVLGNLLNPLRGIGPEDLKLGHLVAEIQRRQVLEVVLALPASVDGQATAHVLSKKLKPLGVKTTSLAKGLPVGAGIDYMDAGTLHLALLGRQNIE